VLVLDHSLAQVAAASLMLARRALGLPAWTLCLAQHYGLSDAQLADMATCVQRVAAAYNTAAQRTDLQALQRR
jgi:hypothetical protein